MIQDTLSHLYRYATLHPLFPEAIALLKEYIGRFPADGKYPEGENGIQVNIQRYKTVPAEEKTGEAHRKFIDLQFVRSGNETILYAPLSRVKVLDEYNEERDLIRLSRPDSELKLQEGDFAIFFPEDAHMPGLIGDGHPSSVEKVVVKIPFSVH